MHEIVLLHLMFVMFRLVSMPHPGMGGGEASAVLVGHHILRALVEVGIDLSEKHQPAVGLANEKPCTGSVKHNHQGFKRIRCHDAHSIFGYTAAHLLSFRTWGRRREIKGWPWLRSFAAFRRISFRSLRNSGHTTIAPGSKPTKNASRTPFRPRCRSS